ncbi:MAG: hypothetical protein LBD23_18155 [Oscillospiraceae bacterium]|jgi:uroporphyrinogen decarboxylase|nr:hypothetical protein [Oscillospiraceae bacterium]
MGNILFSPTIIEHAAFLIDRTPSAVALDSSLMARAHVEAYSRYKPASVTVGIDIYNIEAEALGCKVQFYNDASIPGIVSHPYTLESDPKKILFSPQLGRISLILDAASEVKRAIGNDVTVNIAICGPFSVFIGLLGYEAAIDALFEEDERIIPLMEAVLDFLKQYCDEIAARDLGVVVFESWAAPPLISPIIYRAYAALYQHKLLSHISELNIPTCPLVIGGDTSTIVDDILATGTTLLVSDYNTSLEQYTKKARNAGAMLRANINPKHIWNGEWTKIQARIDEIQLTAQTFSKLIAGSGVIAYDTPIENLLRVKKMLNL